ncbi:hypothetical protein FNU76_00125 [Chitinimonas arctica]|uniref:Uncharacterized protein n=1 Tax=Chitinimonas arctica TaxID=2594795 RepID=A0A516S9P9_9NEIS|nr:hypothetical protein [Chitinimonas arctica]QDQ24873.1 hypothetical protein FNU76_00125 [Chitinimonas arctica]
MDSFAELENALEELSKNRQALADQYHHFGELQRQILSLQEQAEHDQGARDKLAKLDKLSKAGLDKKCEVLFTKLERVNAGLGELDQLMEQGYANQPANPSAVHNAGASEVAVLAPASQEARKRGKKVRRKLA